MKIESVSGTKLNICNVMVEAFRGEYSEKIYFSVLGLVFDDNYPGLNGTWVGIKNETYLFVSQAIDSCDRIRAAIDDSTCTDIWHSHLLEI